MTTYHGERQYEDAVRLLNGLQTNASILESIRKSGGKLNAKALPEMRDYLRRLGYETSDLNRLGIIHIAGTKGKGSTAAFTSSILTNLKPKEQDQGLKVGLYTSPHLLAVRERIKIGGTSISEEEFAKYFFEVWDKLDLSQPSMDLDTTLPDGNVVPLPSKPVYFRYVTLMALHVYLQENVDVVVLEVGMGGEFDSTNIVEKPCVTGISALGIDHVAVLGDKLTDIAWHKAGIFKKEIPAITVPQPDDAMGVLKQRADQKTTTLEVCTIPPTLSKIKLGLAGQFQYSNAALAVALVQTFLRVRPDIAKRFSEVKEELPTSFVPGLEQVEWPGRCQELKVGSNSWYLDGAHTVESLAYCLQWFLSAQKHTVKLLIFNCTSGRDGLKLISSIKDNLKGKSFDQVIFCTNVTYSDGQSKGDLTNLAVSSESLQAQTVQHQLATIWHDHFGADVDVSVVPTIQDAVQLGTSGADGIDVLVTGSLHLVGGVLDVLSSNKQSSV